MNESLPIVDVVCQTSIELYCEHSSMKALFIAELFFGVVAMLSATFLTLSIFFNKTLHFNVRILLICFCAALLVANIGVVLTSVYYLFSIFFRPRSEQCQWLVFGRSDCLALRNIYRLGASVVVLSTLLLSIERITATLLYRTYEQQQRRWIGILLALIQWSLTLPILLCEREDTGLILPYCTPELFDPSLARNLGYILIVVQCCAMLIFMVLWSHNHKRSVEPRSRENALSVRYQVRENISTTRMLAPIVVLNGLFIAAIAVLFATLLPVYRHDSDINTYLQQVSRYSIYAEIRSSIVPLITIVLVYFMGHLNPHIRHSLEHLVGLDRCGPKNGNAVDVTPEEHARQLYFDQLQQQWNQPDAELTEHRIKRTERGAIYAT